jgi:hypothetical protein
MAEKARKFYLRDAAPDSVLGLSRFKGKIGKDGLITGLDPADVAQMAELERMAVTPETKVEESEPEGA